MMQCNVRVLSILSGNGDVLHSHNVVTGFCSASCASCATKAIQSNSINKRVKESDTMESLISDAEGILVSGTAWCCWMRVFVHQTEVSYGGVT